MKAQMAMELGLPAEEGKNLVIAQRPTTRSSKPEAFLPKSITSCKTILISALEDARATIHN
jgi:hypothetical protein